MPERKRQIRWAFWRRRSARDLACIEVVELVTAYLEDALSAEDRAAFEAHIAACPHCTAYLEQMRATLAVAGRIDPEGLSEHVRDDLLAAFREWSRA
jgi:anti-sigma factor RsiW